MAAKEAEASTRYVSMVSYKSHKRLMVLYKSKSLHDCCICMSGVCFMSTCLFSKNDFPGFEEVKFEHLNDGTLTLEDLNSKKKQLWLIKVPYHVCKLFVY